MKNGPLLRCPYWIHTAAAAAAVTHSMWHPTRHYSLNIIRHNPAFKRRSERSNIITFILAVCFIPEAAACEETAFKGVFCLPCAEFLTQRNLRRHHLMPYLLACRACDICLFTAVCRLFLVLFYLFFKCIVAAIFLVLKMTRLLFTE